jgi:hypothetical protein
MKERGGKLDKTPSLEEPMPKSFKLMPKRIYGNPLN